MSTLPKGTSSEDEASHSRHCNVRSRGHARRLHPGRRQCQRRRQLHQHHPEGRPPRRDDVGLVPEHGARRRQLQRAERRGPGLLDERRCRRRRVRQVPDGGLRRQRGSRRGHARSGPDPDLPGPGRPRGAQRLRLRGRQGELQRRRLEGRLGRRRRLRCPGRRWPHGDDLPQGHLRAVRHHASDHLGRVRGRSAEGQGCRRTAVRRPRCERPRGDDGAAVPERRAAVHVRRRIPGEHRHQPQRRRLQGGARLLGRARRRRAWSARRTSSPPSTSRG